MKYYVNLIIVTIALALVLTVTDDVRLKVLSAVSVVLLAISTAILRKNSASEMKMA